VRKEVKVQGDAGGMTADGGESGMTVNGGTARPRRVAQVVVAIAVLMGTVLLAGCQAAAPATQVAGAVEQKVPQAKIAITPAPSSVDVRPDATVKVTATGGKLTQVTLTDDKDQPVTGALSADGLSWTAKGALRFGTHYWVKASAVDVKGLTTNEVAVFTTLTPKAELKTYISPLNGSTVGVGMPLIVRFSQPVTNRADVERQLAVKTSKPVEGAWRWVSDEEVRFRPREFWPANTGVTLTANLLGVDAGKAVWGAKNRTVRFTIGASMVSVIDVQKHRMTVYRNGKVARSVPVSTGKDGFLTRNGVKVVMEKFKLKVMDAATIGINKNDPEYYRLEVPYALRVTYSGEFVHAAPWSVAHQGRDNVSHGCVGMSTPDAIWLFNNTHIGDVVQVVGSPRRLEPGNGWTDWNVPWSQWLQGSAL
jgi:lipoprotein-anchoring transpeptidase ErfK/SrfK